MANKNEEKSRKRPFGVTTRAFLSPCIPRRISFNASWQNAMYRFQLLETGPKVIE